ncbi:MAG TPA: hypothetical protein VNI54_11470 [Thermoanaerobaculia bacterium]|nr:hypothetical protein [Thermoanaerobaculia bacterium]
MRSSSVKTLVSTLSLVVALVAVAPAASAGPAGPRDAAPVIRNEPRGIERIARAARRFVNRLAGGIGTNELPVPPLPTKSTTNQ